MLKPSKIPCALGSFSYHCFIMLQSIAVLKSSTLLVSDWIDYTPSESLSTHMWESVLLVGKICQQNLPFQWTHQSSWCYWCPSQHTAVGANDLVFKCASNTFKIVSSFSKCDSTTSTIPSRWNIFITIHDESPCSNLVVKTMKCDWWILGSWVSIPAHPLNSDFRVAIMTAISVCWCPPHRHNSFNFQSERW